MTREWTDKKGRVIRVFKAPWGNWTLYQTRDLKRKGERVKRITEESKADGHKGPTGIWFNTEKDALDGLQILAAKEGWKPLALDPWGRPLN